VDNAPRAFTPGVRTATSGLVLRRKCACGTHTPGGATCDACNKKKLQRKSMGAAKQGEVPASVRSVLASAGTPLATAVRAPMEHGFGHDFSRVRVHSDAQAARSADDVDARAYTVGSHVVFGGGHYAPHSRAGLHLLAHELAHVVQQSGSEVQRKARGFEVGAVNDPAEREADDAADRVMANVPVSSSSSRPVSLQRAPRDLPHQAPHRAPAIVGLDEDGPGADLTGKTETQLWKCMKGTSGIPNACPKGNLTWRDFSEVPSMRGNRQAQTGWTVAVKNMEPKAARCVQQILGWSENQTHIYQALFVRPSSLVISRVVHAAEPARNGCGNLGAQCRRHFVPSRRNPNPGSFTWTPDNSTCPAMVVGGMLEATKPSECDLIVKGCTANLVNDKPRLLKHEQGHMDLVCAMVRKINAAVVSGQPWASFQQNAFDAINKVHREYDGNEHGCDQAQQDDWEARISMGLPDVALPEQTTPPPPRPPRRPGSRTRPRTRPPGTSMRL